MKNDATVLHFLGKIEKFDDEEYTERARWLPRGRPVLRFDSTLSHACSKLSDGRRMRQHILDRIPPRCEFSCRLKLGPIELRFVRPSGLGTH